MTNKLVVILEGEGDEVAIPILIRRILEEQGVYGYKIIPHRRGDLPKVKRKFSNFYNTAILENAPVLCALDFDCDFCSDVLKEEEEFRNLALNVRPDWAFEACFFVKEYETLFLADFITTRTVIKEISQTWQPKKDPEKCRDAKGEITRAMTYHASYNSTELQAKLTAQVNLAHLRIHCPSFKRFESALFRLAGVSK